MLDPNTTTTKLLTLLNVTAARPTKKPRLSDKWNEASSSSQIKTKSQKSEKSSGKNQQHSVIIDETGETGGLIGTAGSSDIAATQNQEEVDKKQNSEQASGENDKQQSFFNSHFAPDSHILKLIGKAQVQSRCTSDFGPLQSTMPDGETLPNFIEDSLAYHLQQYKDFYHPSFPLGKRQIAYDKVAKHVISHVTLTRKKIVKNNERLSHTKDSALIETDTRDQGFTRPKILLLSPQRNFAFKMLQSLVKETKKMSLQSENFSRAQREFSALSEDKISSNPSAYAKDHVEVHAGNTDDNFLLGMKLTRKSLKLYSDFYSSDIIIASPLGLKLAYEKSSNCDYLSSIEILVMDGLDVMTMQNWQLILEILDPQSPSRLNNLPTESHGCDFSRVKPWYLDDQARFFRQTIMFSSYDTIDLSALYHTLANPSGKSKVTVKSAGVLQDIAQMSAMTESSSISQTFNKISCSFVDEPDQRFKYFTEKFLPTLSQSESKRRRCLIVVPSTFDFIRVKNFMISNQALHKFSFTYISEETEPSDIARARHQFFSGKKEILLITERFHFYRRYKIRGFSTLVFYQLPEHANYYSEFISFPFSEQVNSNMATDQDENFDDEEKDILPALDGGVHVIFTKWDNTRLSAIVGSKNASKMIKSEEKVFSFE